MSSVTKANRISFLSGEALSGEGLSGTARGPKPKVVAAASENGASGVIVKSMF